MKHSIAFVILCAHIASTYTAHTPDHREDRGNTVVITHATRHKTFLNAPPASAVDLAYPEPDPTYTKEEPFNPDFTYFVPRSAEPTSATREHSPLSETREEHRSADGYVHARDFLDTFVPQQVLQEEEPVGLMPTGVRIPPADKAPAPMRHTANVQNSNANHTIPDVADEAAVFMALFETQTQKQKQPDAASSASEEREPSDEDQKQSEAERQSSQNHEQSNANHPVVARPRKKQATSYMPEPMQHVCARLGLDKVAAYAAAGLGCGLVLTYGAQNGYARYIPVAGAGIGLYLATQENKH